MDSFARWLGDTELGHYLLEREQAFYDRTVADVFGFHAVQLGLAEYDFLRTNRIAWQARVGRSPSAVIQTEPERLPFDCRSIDLLVLPHVLDFSRDPHQVLREVERVLMPEGRVVLTGFNPASLWGMRRLARGRDQAPWNGRFLTLQRIKDWLKLLGMEPAGGAFMAYAPPFSHQQWLNRFAFMESAGNRWWPVAAGVYGIAAVKKVRGMRLITPSWNKAKASKGLVVAGPDRRHSAHPPSEESK
jgi:SAM-dependent methyltransferase